VVVAQLVVAQLVVAQLVVAPGRSYAPLANNRETRDPP
jgi:hypothetical protein